MKLVTIALAVAMSPFMDVQAQTPFGAVATPESQGVSSRAILSWIEACEETAATNGFRHGFLHGFVIVRHGKLVAEGSWRPHDTLNEPHMLYSHSKSFTSTAVGFLVDDGRLDLDERVVDLLPDSLPGTLSDNLRQLRVRDLLTMNMGADRTDAERDDTAGDWVKAILANGFQHAPGTRFKYDSAATHLLAAIVERRSGKRLMDFLRERLFVPLGMTSPWSTTSPMGIACGGWGMNMTTRDIAVFGQFLLQKGVWKGRRLLSEDWITLATSKQTRSNRRNREVVVGAKAIDSGDDWAQGYGFQFWRCQHGAFRADGAAGQLTVVFPSEDAVVSINAGLGNMQRELDLIWKHLLPAFAAAPLPPDVEAQMELKRKCESLALPLYDSHPKVFEGMDAAEIVAVDGGWRLQRGDAVLDVGAGGWKITEWRFTDDNVEPIFGKCGVRKIAATGKTDELGRLEVTWQMLGGIGHGSFKVVDKEACHADK